jgi:hypothetical protein
LIYELVVDYRESEAEVANPFATIGQGQGAPPRSPTII